MAYIGPNAPSTAADDSSLSGDTWSNPNNAKVADGSYATVTDTNPNHTHYLKTTNYGFSVPDGSYILGIVVEILRHASANGANNVTDYAMRLAKPSGGFTTANRADTISLWPTSDAYAVYGSSSDLWGESWNVADINSSSFGAALSASLNPDTTVTASVDFIRITVYYSAGAQAGNVDMQKRYIYKVYDKDGIYLGNLPKPSSDFSFPQDINTGGSQITVVVPVSADTSALPTADFVLDESGGNVQDEGGADISSDGGNIFLGIGAGPDELIKNGNEVVVMEYSYYHPNGIPMFRGTIKRWEATFGGDGADDTITLLIYSDGQDLSNHMIRGYGSLALDQVQTTSDADTTFPSPGITLGQTFTTGTGVNHIGAITIYCKVTTSTPATVTVHLCDRFGTTEYGSATMLVASTTPYAANFIFPSPIAVTASTQYFFFVSFTGGAFDIAYNSTNVYSGGNAYSYSGGWISSPSADLYFETYSAPYDTTATYGASPNVDPTIGMLEPFMDNYAAEGGKITYNSSSIDATGLTLEYTFNTNTVYEGIQAVLSISPSDFYFYVDLGMNTLYFKQASTSADIVLTKGRHLNQIKIVASIEYIVNEVFFSGGVVSGQNVYTYSQDSTSIALYGPAIDRKSDNRVTSYGTAFAIGDSEVAEKKDEAYQTEVTIVDKTIDTTIFKPGLVIGFAGFGTFIDDLLAQIVHIDYTPEQVTLQLGLLPKRLMNQVERATKGLIALDTIQNPVSPS
jgi:hypothetical protein